VPVVGAAVAAIKAMSAAELAASSRATTYAAFALS
jgi:hypothetical protein